MKFFRGGFTKVLVDTDRALKNELNEQLKMFILDTRSSFSDRQMIRSLLIMAKNTDLKVMKDKDKLF